MTHPATIAAMQGTAPQLRPLDIGQYWRSVQGDLAHIAGLYSDDNLDWTPKESLWNSRGILIHVSDARDRWLTRDVQDGEPYPNIWTTARTTEDMKRELTRTFARLERFLANQAQLDRTYADERDAKWTYDGHWIAFHLLEHDIHHRAELLQRLALLDIAHGIDI
jgi:uncharacterized damage-inducible protein DinB